MKSNETRSPPRDSIRLLLVPAFIFLSDDACMALALPLPSSLKLLARLQFKQVLLMEAYCLDF